MQARQLIGILLAFALTNATSVFASGVSPDEPFCEPLLVPAAATQLTVGMVVQIESPGDGWLAWHRDEQGRAWLAAQSSPTEMKVYQPLVNAEPFFSHVTPVGSQFARASWSESTTLAEIVAGDDQGNLWRYHPLSSESKGPEFQGASVDVLPAPIGNLIALGLGNAARVRIMPVGNVVPPRELSAKGPVLDMKVHTTTQGRRLVAVVSAQAVQVFDLDSGSADPIFSSAIDLSVKVEWIVDDAGESALLYENSGALIVEYPLSGKRIVRSVHVGSTAEALRTAGGEVLVSLSHPDLPVEILGLRRDEFVSHAQVAGSAPAQALVENPNGAVYVAYMSEPPGLSRLHIAKLSDLSTPIFTLTFEDDKEAVKGFALQALSADHQLLAVGTNTRIYILDLHR
ncbi:MAG: hypothetical protein KF799_11125 [Bdellovibrionales bacterium]|nr:hypothetical protein [Bdellovibrionales bacterium]